jgi:hypothetical protein
VDLAEKYAPDTTWFVGVMAEVRAAAAAFERISCCVTLCTVHRLRTGVELESWESWPRYVLFLSLVFPRLLIVFFRDAFDAATFVWR